MANNIFEDIGSGIQGVLGGARQHLRRGFEATGRTRNIEQERKQAKMAQEIKIILAMPAGTQSRAIATEQFMKKHKPEIAALVPQGGYQAPQESPYGKPPYHLDPKVREQYPEETAIAGGTKPRAESPWKSLREMADTEANLGVNPLTGKPRFPKLTEQINKRIGGFQLPGAEAAEKRAKWERAKEGALTGGWLDRAGEPEPVVVPKGEPSLWENLKKSIRGYESIRRRLWSKTGEGYTKTSGPDKAYGKPQTGKDKAPTMFQLQKEAGIYDREKPLDIFSDVFTPSRAGALTDEFMGKLPPVPENPYKKEYPDAFLEDDVWKVMRNGKKYRIEE